MKDDKTLRPDDSIIPSTTNNTIRPDDKIIESISSIQQAPTHSLGTGPIIINGKSYTNLDHIASMGEAEVYKAFCDPKWLVIKYYYSNFSPQKEIMESLKDFYHPDIINLIDTAWLNNRFIEILEFAAGGSLADNLPERDEKQIRIIIREVIEALQACHEKGIIHRDIKPGNIFYRSRGKKDVAIGDFGISSPLKKGEDYRLTRRFLTHSYGAPELLTGLNNQVYIGKEVDYYALGVTLIHLWTGNDPFGMLPDYEATRKKLDGRIPTPDDFPQDLLILVKGLLTVEPSKRWGYNEVNDWLLGKNVKVNFEISNQSYTNFSFGRPKGSPLNAANPVELAALMEEHPDLGKRHLYKHTISNWLKDSDPGLFIEIQKLVEEDFPIDMESGFIKALYLLDMNKPFIPEKGIQCHTQIDIAETIQRDRQNFMDSLKKPNAPFYLFLEARGYSDQANQFREMFKKRTPLASINFIILSLLNQTCLSFNNITLHHPTEILQQNQSDINKLIPELLNQDSMLSVWCESFTDVNGKISQWRNLPNADDDLLFAALGQGLRIDSTLLETPDCLVNFLHKNSGLLFAEELNESLANKFEVWLKTYHQTSLVNVIINLFFKNPPKESTLIDIWDYLLDKIQSEELDFVDFVRKSIPIVINKYPDKIEPLADILSIHIDGFISNRPNGVHAYDRFVRFLNLYNEFHNTHTHAEFLQKTLIILDKQHVIENGFSSDLESFAGNEPVFNKYKSTIDQISGKLKQLGFLTTIERPVLEEKMLRRLEPKLKKDIEEEKKDKIKLVKDSFSSVTKKRKEFKAYSSNKNYYKTIGLSLTTVIISVVLFFSTFFFNPEIFTEWMGYIVGGVFGLAALALLASSMDDGCLVVIVLIALASYVGYSLGKHIQLEYLQWILFSIAILGVTWLIFSFLKRRIQLAGSQLSDNEKEKFADNLDQTEVYYAGKLNSDIEYHRMHCATLSREAFVKEYGDYL